MINNNTVNPAYPLEFQPPANPGNVNEIEDRCGVVLWTELNSLKIPIWMS